MRKQILTVALVIVFLVMVFAPIAKTETERSALDQLRDAPDGLYLYLKFEGTEIAGRVTRLIGEIHTEAIEKERPKIERAGGEA